MAVTKTLKTEKLTSTVGAEVLDVDLDRLLNDEEKERYANLRVVHSFVAARRPLYPNPTPEQLAEWESRGSQEHPLVWTHETGRRSLVLGSSADYIVGMDVDEGRSLLDDLLE